MKNIKRKIKIISLIIFVVSVLFTIVAFCISDIPVNVSYTYSNNKIIAHSWHNYYENIIAIMSLIILLTVMVEIVMLIVCKIREKEKISGNISLVTASAIFSFIALGLSDILVIGLWSESDYSPQCYKFTDNQHTIVIEEESFLLYGGATIYQIQKDNKAIIIGKITTDDGGRNYGNYEIEWLNNGAEITYNDCNLKNNKLTEKVNFK